MNETISVIVTCYNLENYIGVAIESVLAQTYKNQLEVIVVDDCSTDASARIIASYPGVRYLRTAKNSGVLLATILGIEASTGDILCFLDGDDIWDDNKIYEIKRKFDSDPTVALVTHDLWYVNQIGGIIKSSTKVESVMQWVPRDCQDAEVRKGILLHRNYVWLGSAYSIRRKAGEVGEFCKFIRSSPELLQAYQDWPLAFWIACLPGVRIGYVSRKLLYYRLHGLNHSGDSSSIEKCIRNFNRNLMTTRALSEISVFFDVDSVTRSFVHKKLLFDMYLVDLYRDSRSRAFKGFFKSIPYLLVGTPLFIREFFRFIAIQAVGANRFVEAKNLLRGVLSRW